MATPKKPASRGSSKPKKPANKRGKPATNCAKAVEIFTASFCPHCSDAKLYLKMKGIPFTEYNLERSKDAEKRFRGYGGKAIPLLIVKGRILRRWDVKAFEKLYF